MKRIFVTLYITLGITTILAIFGITYITEYITYPLELKEESDEFRGTFNLLISEIEKYPEKNWGEKLDGFREYFDFPVEIIPLDKANIDSDYRKDLLDGKIVSEPGNVGVLYKRFEKSDYVISIGPLPEVENKGLIYSLIIASFLFILAVPVFIWSFLFWKDLLKVEKTSSSFGQGDMTARVEKINTSAVTDLAGAFNSMAEKISSLIESHKDLTNAVSHELRTPISRIKFEIEMLKTTEDETSKERYIKGIERDITEIEELVDEMLTYAKYDRDPEFKSLPKHDIALWLDRLVSDLKKETDKSINLNIPGKIGDCLICFDPFRLEWAVKNLIRNAVRFSESNIGVILELDVDYCLIHVEDDGPGIPEDKRERIFEPFFRIESSRNKKFGGYGLGLAIVQKVIKWHKGKVVLSDSNMGGARFTISLPVHSKEPNPDI